MLFLYFVFVIISIFFSRKYMYNSIINPISIYGMVWFVAFFFHECGIVYYYKISWNTFFCIVVAHCCFIIGAMLGVKISKFQFIKYKKEHENVRRQLKYNILIISCVSGVGIIRNFINTLLNYGIGLKINYKSLYQDNVSQALESSFSLSSLLYVAVSLTGIYIVKYGYEKCLLLPVVLMIISGLSSGSRGSFIIQILLFVSSISLISIEHNKEQKTNIRGIKFLFIIMTIIVFIITLSRGSGNTSADNKNILVRFVVGYMASGIGCLDQYLMAPDVVGYPQYLFRVPFIVFNKLGITSVDTRYHINTYFIPDSSNVITYIGELYHDFGELYFIPIVFMSVMFSDSYCRAKRTGTIFSYVMYSSFFTVFCLSFFANFIHVASIWYVILFGGTIAFFVDKVKLKL